MKVNKGDYIKFILGIIFTGIGIFLFKNYSSQESTMFTLAVWCTISGLMMIAFGITAFITKRFCKNIKEIAEIKDTIANDERNVNIKNIARAKTHKIVLLILCALEVSFSLMQVDLIVILSISALLLFDICCEAYYTHKLNKKM